MKQRLFYFFLFVFFFSNLTNICAQKKYIKPNKHQFGIQTGINISIPYHSDEAKLINSPKLKFLIGINYLYRLNERIQLVGEVNLFQNAYSANNYIISEKTPESLGDFGSSVPAGLLISQREGYINVKQTYLQFPIHVRFFLGAQKRFFLEGGIALNTLKNYETYWAYEMTTYAYYNFDNYQVLTNPQYKDGSGNFIFGIQDNYLSYNFSVGFMKYLKKDIEYYVKLTTNQHIENANFDLMSRNIQLLLGIHI